MVERRGFSLRAEDGSWALANNEPQRHGDTENEKLKKRSVVIKNLKYIDINNNFRAGHPDLKPKK
jgi:hypothetical protein